LHGAVRLRIEGAKGPADICVAPAARLFFRGLHERWPWAGYFLRLQPVTLSSPMDRIRDLAWYVGLCLCRAGNISYIRNKDAGRILFQPEQFSLHLAELHTRAWQLGEAVGLPAAAIARRDALMLRAVTSYFAAGKAHHQQIISRNHK